MPIPVAEAPTNLDELRVLDMPATEKDERLSIGRVVAGLQLLLAARRAVRNDDFAARNKLTSRM